MEVANRPSSFGCPLLNENFGQRTTDDDVKALDPFHLEVADGPSAGASENKPEMQSALDPLLQNPDGATQMFNDMHGLPVGLERSCELHRPGVEPGVGPNNSSSVGAPIEAQEDKVLGTSPARTELRHMGGLNVEAQRLGATDWGVGTDGGRSGRLENGVPYGYFAGV